MQQKIPLTSISSLVLESKRESREEFFINLFEYCNLSCSFCWQDHDSTVGMDFIQDNATRVCDIISSRINTQRFDVNVMGGELFCDEIDDALFEEYKQFAITIQNHADTIGKDVAFNWVTNLVFENGHRMIWLMEGLQSLGIKSLLTTSYDPKGRFNPATRELFTTNLNKYQDHIRNISMVLTRPNIQRIISDTDEYFKFLYDNYIVYFDYYSPEKSAEIMAPSDEELFDVFRFLIDNYPKVQPVADWINKNENGLTCRSSNILLPDGTSGKCRILVDKKDQGNFETPLDSTDNQNMEETFINRNNCLSCEYFQRCGLGCFLHSDFMPRGRMNECVFKLTFDYITKQ